MSPTIINNKVTLLFAHHFKKSYVTLIPRLSSVSKTFEKEKCLGLTFISFSCFRIMMRHWNSCFIYYLKCHNPRHADQPKETYWYLLFDLPCFHYGCSDNSCFHWLISGHQSINPLMARGVDATLQQVFPIFLGIVTSFICKLNFFTCRLNFGTSFHEKNFQIGLTVLALKLDKGRVLGVATTPH